MPPVAKRKKTADMPDSPPKRVTRARAKASKDDDSKAKTVKIMTPSAKAAMERRKPAEAAKAVKRKLRTDDEREEAVEESVEEPSAKEVAKPRGRAKKVQQADEQSADIPDAPKKTRGRPLKTESVDEPKRGICKPRTRATKLPDAEIGTKPKEATDEKLGPAKNTARTRAKTAATKPPATSTVPKSSVPKKKVKFQEDTDKDKENAPIDLEKSVPKVIGLKAKPIRKPATARSSTRGRKAAVSNAENKVPSHGRNALPLSPKKVNQIAKSSSTSSEDELACEKTPTRALSQSPVKPPPSAARKPDGVVSTLNFSAAPTPSSPTKTIPSSVFQSPARRPPPSPFKDALRQSPKKGSLGDPFTISAPATSQSPLKNTMRDSPRKGLVVPFLKPTLATKTPSKATLLQSPARRPGGSTMRKIVAKSPGRAPAREACKANVTPLSSPQEACSSPLRAARTPGQPFKVHTTVNNTDAAGADSTGRDPIFQEGVASCVAKSPVIFSSPITPLAQIEADATELTENDDQSSPRIVEENAPDVSNGGRGDSDRTGSRTPLAEFTFAAPAFSLASPAFRCSIDESDSEDELASPQKIFLNTPLQINGVSMKDFGIQGAELSSQARKRATPNSRADRHSIAMTPLAAQMSAWLASSPEKKVSVDASEHDQLECSPTTTFVQGSPPKASFFEDEMAVLDARDESVLNVPLEDIVYDLGPLQTSQESQASEEYGDENEMPIDPQLVRVEDMVQDLTVTCTPAKVFYTQPREIHTVSKVPLRPAADDEASPLKIPRKRSKSLAGPSSLASDFQGNSTSVEVISTRKEQLLVQNDVFEGDSCFTPLKHRSGNDDSLIETPRTLRKNVVSKVLKGAIVFVDVHTTEGEDASGIFLELLAQMGARCVKQWSWNPRASSAMSFNSPTASENELTEAEASNKKTGITHVVYKDGGKRTMEKVRASKGAVHCVGVGWVLDCEREDKWLDEADYAIDTLLIPRGGHRRRKSMEPRMLANLNGNLIPAQTPIKPAAEMSPTKEFLTFDTPASRRDSFAIEPAAPATPTAQDSGDAFGDSPLSPTTPYYLSKGAQLVQQTCPPKQTQDLLFPVSGRIDDQPDEVVRQRLLMARRKSLQWMPKISSPLGRAVSYGK